MAHRERASDDVACPEMRNQDGGLLACVVTYAEGPNGWQTLSVSGEGANPGVDDLRRLAKDVGLDRDESEPILESVIEACRNFVQHGVS